VITPAVASALQKAGSYSTTLTVVVSASWSTYRAFALYVS
jgi:hypothetical protein